MIKGQGKLERTAEGALRESNKGRGRFDLFPYEAMEALAIWYEQGGEKYGDRNWEKGLNIDDTLNRMTRHAIKACNGWNDEDHLSAVMWNAAAVITLRARATKSAEALMNVDIDEEENYRQFERKMILMDSNDEVHLEDMDKYVLSEKEARARQAKTNRELERLKRAQDKEHD